MYAKSALLALVIGGALAQSATVVGAMDHDHSAAMQEKTVMEHDGAMMEHEGAAMDHEGAAITHDHAMMHEGEMAHDATHEMHDGRGVVRRVDAEHGMVNIAHEPMPSLGWPRMRMNFETVDGLDLSGIGDGQSVSFTLRVDENGDYRICEIEAVE